MAEKKIITVAWYSRWLGEWIGKIFFTYLDYETDPITRRPRRVLKRGYRVVTLDPHSAYRDLLICQIRNESDPKPPRRWWRRAGPLTRPEMFLLGIGAGVGLMLLLGH